MFPFWDQTRDWGVRQGGSEREDGNVGFITRMNK